MPITAKFSKKFYDTLGHDIADEMVDWFNRADETYRTDLYRINDLNFARFEAKLEQRFAELEAKLATKSELRELRDELLGALANHRAELLGALANHRAELLGALATQHDDHVGRLASQRDELLGALASQHDDHVGRVASLRDELLGTLASKRDLADLRTDIAERLGALQTDLHRRMFLYWGGLVGVVIAASILG
jgi:chromosome segregation ATPase